MDNGVEPKNFTKMSLADLKEYLKARGVYCKRLSKTSVGRNRKVSGENDDSFGS